MAREAAGAKDVAVAGGGALLRQVLGRAARRARAAHHAGPARRGQRLFAGDLGLGDGEGLELTPLRVVETPEVTHVRYAVTGRHELVLDDRGSGRRPPRLRP